MYVLPREGSKVQLVGLKNPSLNGQNGVITGYAQGGERVMISLVDTPTHQVVKVKPKQMEVLSEAPPDRGVRGMRRRDNRVGHFSFNGSRRGSMNRRESRQQSRDNLSTASNASQELMQVLKSADDMFEMADTSGDGIISRQEFDYYMRKNTKYSPDMIRDAFKTIDKDGDGEITKEEVRRAFFLKRRELKGKQGSSGGLEDELLKCSRDADLLFDRADISGEGEISKREFELYMKRNTKHSDIAIAQLFNMMDVDHDGFITHDEVRRVFLKQKKDAANGGDLDNGGKMSIGDLLGLEDDEMHDIVDDVYNMFFLAEVGGQAFYYALIIFALKVGLFIVITIDLFTNRSMPDFNSVDMLVQVTQFFLLPVAVAIEEELIATFFIYSNLKWSPIILELNPCAFKWKYHLGNFFRLVDGLFFLLINTILMLQATDILSMFLNFAALMFLQKIDNIALHLARDGYLTETLEGVANDVFLMKLPRNHNRKLQMLDSLMLFSTYLVLVVLWFLVRVV